MRCASWRLRKAEFRLIFYKLQVRKTEKIYDGKWHWKVSRWKYEIRLTTRMGLFRVIRSSSTEMPLQFISVAYCQGLYWFLDAFVASVPSDLWISPVWYCYCVISNYMRSDRKQVWTRYLRTLPLKKMVSNSLNHILVFSENWVKVSEIMSSYLWDHLLMRNNIGFIFSSHLFDPCQLDSTNCGAIDNHSSSRIRLNDSCEWSPTMW